MVIDFKNFMNVVVKNDSVIIFMGLDYFIIFKMFFW